MSVDEKPVFKNNFDFLRLLFATFVIVTHSYPLSGALEIDWLSQITGRQLSFSYVGVRGFFVISGFLVFESLMRSKNLRDYFKKRILRIFPGLIVVLLLTVFVLGPIVTNTSLTQYFTDWSTWKYIPKNLLLFFNLQYGITGVFEHNPYPYVINGSLWTIPHEFFLYIVLVGFFFLRKSKFIVNALLVAIFVGLAFVYANSYNFLFNGHYLLPKTGLLLSDLLNFSLFFFGGAVLSAIGIQKLKRKALIAFLAFALLILSVALHVFDLTQFILYPLFLITFGLCAFKYISDIRKVGDYSYGVYLYAFPVQQMLIYFSGNGKLNNVSLALLAIPLTYICGILSWHFVEKKALKFK